MASYYAQIDVNLYEGDGNIKKATTPKPTMLLTTKPKVQTNKQKNFTYRGYFWITPIFFYK